MIKYFKIRSYQLARVLKTIGLIRVIFLFFFLLYLLNQFYLLTIRYKSASFLLICFLTLTIHFQRKDLLFIKTSFQNPGTLLFLEYIIIFSPLLLIILFNVPILISLACIVFLFIISNIFISKPIKNFTKTRNKPSMIIPDNLFEWISGFRKYPYLFLLYIAGLGLSFLPYTAPISSFILICLISSFYQENEPSLYIQKYETSESNFIKQKLKHSLYAVLFILPILICGLTFNIQQYWLALYLIVNSLIGMAAIIVTKYACYLPNRASLEYRICSLIILASIIYFPLMLITIPMMIVNYYRALQNLNNFLYDYNR